MFSFMPVGHPPIKAHPSKPFRTLADEALAGYLMKVNCNLCRRTIYYLATDLVQFVGAAHPVHIPPFACGTCKTMEYMRMTVHSPQIGDYGRLPVRRIDKVVQVTKWKTVLLGE